MQSPTSTTHEALLATPGQDARPSVLRDLVLSARPKQWPKNGLVLLALLFSVNEYWTPSAAGLASGLIATSLAAFLLFCLLSSAEYLINDYVDAATDREHPSKRRRPIAAGRLTRIQVLGAAAVLGGAGLAGSALLQPAFGVVAALYFGLMVAYTLVLKHVVILDVFSIALGFVLRAAGGAVAIGVPISPWLYLCTILGALFIGFAKRRQEIVLLQEGATNHRRILQEYSPALLDQMINIVSASTLIAYGLYTFSAENLPRNHAMMATTPFVMYGIFRYLYLVHHKNLGGSPEEVLLTDRPLAVDIALWLALSVMILVAFRGS